MGVREQDEVWYVAYGSNTSAARFGCYLAGGRPAGGARTYPGCRDTAPPRDDVALQVPGGLFFAGESTVWGGGMAFLDPALPGSVPARAYRLTREQFEDVAAQEVHRAPGAPVPAAPGRYVLLRLGQRDGIPLLTLTGPQSATPAPTAPSAAYLRVVGSGLRETHPGLDVAGYLAGCPGAAGTWTSAEVAAVLGPPR